MKRALVIYESMYGNTEQIARAIGDGLAERMQVDVVEVGVAPTRLAADVGLVIVGGPTHAFSMSRPGTRASAAKETESALVSGGIGVREWLEGLETSESPVAAAYDTHVDHPKFLRHVGSVWKSWQSQSTSGLLAAWGRSATASSNAPTTSDDQSQKRPG